MNPAIVIVGAGPTGLAAANLLGMYGIRTLVLERNATLSDCPKAITIDDEGLRTCQAMGLIDQIVEHCVLNIEAHYLSAQHFLAKVAPTSRRNGYPLISTFHQPTFEAVLLRGLERFPCVEVRFGHTVEAFTQDTTGVTLSIRTSDGTDFSLSCDYLLACDGGKSPIRHALGIPMLQPRLLPRRSKKNRRDADEVQRWLVVDTLDDDDKSHAATFFCEYNRPAVTVPAPSQARRWEFMLLPGDQEADLLRDETIYTFIQQARGSYPTTRVGSLKSNPQILRKTIYAFRSVAAQRFMQSRVFLLGDAAHLMPPFGGQGMNSGLRDAHNLCWKLREVLQQGANPQLLATYQTERAPHVREMILFSSILGGIVMTPTRRASRLRDAFFTCINAIPPLRNAITEMRVKPQPRYRKGFLFPSKSSKQLVGAFLPQPSVMTQDGKKMLLDNVLGNEFAALRLYENPEHNLKAIMPEYLMQDMKVQYICVLSEHSPFPQTEQKNCIFVRDEEGVLEKFLRYRKDSIVVVRPDRYVAGVFQIGEQ